MSANIDIDDLCELLDEHVDNKNSGLYRDAPPVDLEIKISTPKPEPGEIFCLPTETKVQKRAREKEELEATQKKYVTVIAKQVAIKNGYLLRFPVGLANCLNGANFSGLTELMDSYFFHNCKVQLAFSSEANFSCVGGAGLVNFFSLVNSFYPDRIMVVHTAVAADNKLTASFYYKFTDCKYLYDAVASRPIDPTYESLFPAVRGDSLKRKMRMEGSPRSTIAQMKNLVESDNDLVVYGSFHMQMAIQEVTEKIIGMTIIGNFSSAHVAPDGPKPMFSSELDDLRNSVPRGANVTKV